MPRGSLGSTLFLTLLIFVVIVGGCLQSTTIEKKADTQEEPVVDRETPAPHFPETPTLTAPPKTTSTTTESITTVSTTSSTTISTTTQSKALEISANIDSNCMGFLIGAPEEARTISMAGGAWARPHPGPFAWQWIEPQKDRYVFEVPDHWVSESQRYNIALLGTIWPYADWDQATCHETSCEVTTEDEFYPREKFGKIDGIPKSRCAPCNKLDYEAFIKALVERYDGDGEADMPGLKIPVKYWEILNEPEMDSPTLTFYKGTKEEYVETLQTSYEAIKLACPDCTVVQGGAAGSPGTLNYWGEILDLGGAQYFDIANVHFISFGDQSTLNSRDFKSLMETRGIKKPIWVTEAEFKSESHVISSVEGALSMGVKKIFFTRFIIGQMGPPRLGEYSKVYGQVASLGC